MLNIPYRMIMSRFGDYLTFRSLIHISTPVKGIDIQKGKKLPVLFLYEFLPLAVYNKIMINKQNITPAIILVSIIFII
jgi:hypothetical protein